MRLTGEGDAGMKHQLIFQAAWLTAVFAAYKLLNCLLGACLALLWRWVDDPFLNAIEAIMTKVINLIAVAGLVGSWIKPAHHPASLM